MKSDTRNFGKITTNSCVQNALWVNGTKENERFFFCFRRQVTDIEESTNIGKLFYVTTVCSRLSSALLTYGPLQTLAVPSTKCFICDAFLRAEGQYFQCLQYNENNVMHFLLNLLRIKGLYMFRTLLAHPQEACILCQLAAPGMVC
jgi:hypothetical protein